MKRRLRSRPALPAGEGGGGRGETPARPRLPGGTVGRTHRPGSAAPPALSRPRAVQDGAAGAPLLPPSLPAWGPPGPRRALWRALSRLPRGRAAPVGVRSLRPTSRCRGGLGAPGGSGAGQGGRRGIGCSRARIVRGEVCGSSFVLGFPGSEAFSLFCFGQVGPRRSPPKARGVPAQQRVVTAGLGAVPGARTVRPRVSARGGSLGVTS